MRVDIRWKGLPKSSFLSEHVQKRAHAGLQRFQGKVHTVTVRFEDTNGPRGGVDKRCSVELTGAFGILVAEAQGSDYYAVADLALARGERAVARSLQRDHRSRDRLAEHVPTLPDSAS